MHNFISLIERLVLNLLKIMNEDIVKLSAVIEAEIKNIENLHISWPLPTKDKGLLFPELPTKTIMEYWLGLSKYLQTI